MCDANQDEAPILCVEIEKGEVVAAWSNDRRLFGIPIVVIDSDTNGDAGDIVRIRKDIKEESYQAFTYRVGGGVMEADFEVGVL